ncbi:MAG: hypothetical protein ACK46Q_06570 [Hyphomonas sp.]
MIDYLSVHLPEAGSNFLIGKPAAGRAGEFPIMSRAGNIACRVALYVPKFTDREIGS